VRCKTIVQILGLAALAGGLFQMHSVLTPPSAEARSVSQSGAAFPGFPLDQVRKIELHFDATSLEELTKSTTSRKTGLEQRQQMRDWLLFAVLSDAGLQSDELRQVLFDQPPIRRGYFEAVASYENGSTRSRCIGDGRVIALVPRDSPEQEREDLAHIADEQRKNLGDVPKSVFVFEYELDESQRVGWVTRRKAIDGRELFTEHYGYQQQPITSIEGLKSFLTKMDDLTFASMDGSALTLGGRNLLDPRSVGLRVEDVAALWQSETGVQKAQQELDQLRSRWENKTYVTEEERAALESGFQREVEELKARSDLAEGSGFSLDPAYDYEGLAAFVRRFESELEALVSTEDVREAVAGLESRNEVPLLKLLDGLSRSEEPRAMLLGGLLQASQEMFRFQAARYDGRLQGTEVGMVLFYTDLLAKLWALDFVGSAPKPEAVEDFVPLLTTSVSPIYLQEETELPSTRLWFGPRSLGFQIVEAGPSVLFARNATRIYAASSNPLKPGEEAEPNASSSAFLGWWDNHYEEVARFEPQYQRLNEIMKWSLVISWLAENGQMERLGFVAEHQVDHSNWFPVWVQRQPDLRFHDWSKVEFENQRPGTSFNGVTTEALPILKSEEAEQASGAFWLSGGVSLGNKKIFAERISLPEEISPLLRRSHLDYRAIEGLAEGRAFRLKTLEEADFEFGSILADRAPVVARAREAAKLRAPDLELKNLPFELNYRATPAGLRIDARAGSSPLGRFAVSRAKNGFKVGFESLDLEQANALGRKVVDSVLDGKEPARVLAADSRVAAVVHTEGVEGWFVRIKGSDRWLGLHPEGEPTAAMAESAEMRVGGWRPGGQEAPRFVAGWVEEGIAPVQLKEVGHVEVKPPVGSEGGISIVTNRGPPPPTARDIELAWGDVRVPAKRDVGGHYYFEGKNLPEALQKDPSRLRELIGSKDAVDLENRLARLQNGSYAEVAGDLSRDPVLFKKQIQQLRASRIREAEQEMAAGRPDEASRIFDTLIDVFGPDPDLSVRQALARLGEGKVAGAADALGDVLPAIHDPAPLFAGIDARLAQPGISAGERIDLFKLGRALDMQSLAARNPLQKTAVRLATDSHGQLDFHLLLLDAARGRRVAWSDIRSRRVYLDLDDPALHNVDWSPGGTMSFPEPVSQRLTVLELPNWEIAHAQPGVIEQVATKHRYRLASQALRLENLRSYSSLRNEPCSSAADRDQRPDCDPYVYLVTTQPAPPPGPRVGS